MCFCSLPCIHVTCANSATKRFIFFLPLAEPASTKENNCLSAAKACNLNDTCKKYRSAYINPCTSRVSASEICNKRKCHKALRHFFDKVISTEGLFGLVFFLVFLRFFRRVQGFRVWHFKFENKPYLHEHLWVQAPVAVSKTVWHFCPLSPSSDKGHSAAPLWISSVFALLSCTDFSHHQRNVDLLKIHKMLFYV